MTTNKIERILYPTDFSPFAAQALRHALALVQKLKAHLKVVHVVPHFFLDGESAYGSVPWLVTPAVRQYADESLRTFLKPVRDARIDYEVEVREGRPWREILAAATFMRADLVVMGTHGHGGLDRLLLGSVAEKLIRRLPCPVMTVCHEEGRTWETPGLISRILCATDFSATSTEALGLAVLLGRKHGADVTLLHVVETLPEFVGTPHGVYLDLEALRASLERDATARLRSAIEAADASGVKVEVRVEVGRAYKEILRVAAQERADLIVVGAEGHGVIEHLFSGSNAQHIIRSATCPVLTARPLRFEAGPSGPQPTGLVAVTPASSE